MSSESDLETDWRAHGEEIRRLAAKCLCNLAEKIDNGIMTDEDVSMLSRLSSIAKQWTSEERQAGKQTGEGGAIPDEDLARRARKQIG